MIQVMVVDDQRLMREGLGTLLNMEPDLDVVEMAENGQDAIERLAVRAVDVVLMDIRMPVMDGIQAVREVKIRFPAVKVLMLTTFEEKEDVVNALSAGAVGYLLKDMPAEDIAEAIRVAQSGGAVLPPNIAKTFLSAVQTPSVESVHTSSSEARSVSPASETVALGLKAREHLTDRELDVLHCLAVGFSNKEISERLYVTEGTVKNHVSSLIAKLGLRDRTQVALFAVRNGFGTSVPPFET